MAGRRRDRRRPALAGEAHLVFAKLTIRDGNLWFTRDPRAIAAAKGLGEGLGSVAPFYVEQEGPVPPGGLPRPGKIVANLRNEHLQYAFTWFGLAVVLLVAFGVWAFNSSGEAAAGRPAAALRAIYVSCESAGFSISVPA